MVPPRTLYPCRPCRPGWQWRPLPAKQEHCTNYAGSTHRWDDEIDAIKDGLALDHDIDAFSMSVDDVMKHMAGWEASETMDALGETMKACRFFNLAYKLPKINRNWTCEQSAVCSGSLGSALW